VNPPKETMIKSAGGETNLFERDLDDILPSIGTTQKKVEMPPLIHREPYQQALFAKYPTVQDLLPSQQSQNYY
jgi:hypothetical protein